MSSLVQKSDLISKQDSKAPRSRSKFDLSAHHLTTLQFGKVMPFFNLETVNGDKINLRSAHNLSTFTLKSPILSSVRMRKDYFSVPMESILPNNWQKIYTNPLFGDDVDPKNVSCVLRLKTENRTGISYTAPEGADGSNTVHAYNYINAFSIAEMLFSQGSLLARLGIDLSAMLELRYNKDGKVFYLNIDEAVEMLYSAFPVGKDYNYTVYYSDLKATAYDQYASKTFLNIDSKSKVRQLHDWILEHPIYKITLSAPVFTGNHEIFSTDLAEQMTWPFPQGSFVMNTEGDLSKLLEFNIAPLCAYQLACAHFLTNDKVDDIYSADLYRQMMMFLGAKSSGNAGNPATFKYNDVNTFYDALSGYYINACLDVCISKRKQWIVDATDYGNYCFTYLANLFLPRRSLRYLDYFTGAKTRPLALGDTSVQLTAENDVDVVDVTKGLQMQRFLNFVNRTGRKFEEYVSKLNGTYVAPDFHNPAFLGSTIENLYNPKVENTGAMQFEAPNSVTSTIAGDSNKFAFSFDSDRPSILLGLVSFDIVRSYANCVDRSAFHIDRFDYFNPFLQHIGDQPIYQAEYYLDGKETLWNTFYFGYQTRHSEYKQKVSRADSGFIDGALPSWAFLNQNPYDEFAQREFICSEIIRSYAAEMDQFYLSLPYINNSSYFHFIVDFYNDVKASRPMIATPNIL